MRIVLFISFMLCSLLSFTQTIQSNAIMDQSPFDNNAPCSFCSPWRYDIPNQTLKRRVGSTWVNYGVDSLYARNDSLFYRLTGEEYFAAVFSGGGGTDDRVLDILNSLGVPAYADNMGAYVTPIIPGAGDVKDNLEAVGAAIETNIAGIATNAADVDALEIGQIEGLVGFADKSLMDTTLNSYPTNTIARVANDATSTNNGYYRFNGTAWTFQANLYSSQVIPADEVVAVNGKAVYDFLTLDTLSPLSQLGAIGGTSLIDLYSVPEEDGYINNLGAEAANSSWQRTDFIPIPFGVETVRYTGSWNVSAIYGAFYDANQVFISNVPQGGSAITEKTGIPVPVNAKFCRFSGADGMAIQVYTENFSSSVIDDVSINEQAITELNIGLANTNEALAEVVLSPGTDLVADQGISQNVGYITAVGLVSVNASWNYTDYVNVELADTITYQGNWNNPSIYLAFYDANFAFISVVARGATNITEKTGIPVPANARYCRASTGAGTTIKILTESYFSNIQDQVNQIEIILSAKADTLETNPKPYELVDYSTIGSLFDKLPNFADAYLNKQEDCTVVFIGTSITHGIPYTTAYSDAAFRPIYCQSQSLAGLTWENLRERWNPQQQYRRYDSGYFTETGTWANVTSDAAWDDGAKNTVSRRSNTASASIQFSVPIDAWTTRFVYKSETVGSDCTITVAEGDSQLQVLRLSDSTWVEANGFVFSTVQTANYPSGIRNTNYGAYLRFRATDGSGFDTRATAKTVTITKDATANYLTYWGVEWSKRKYMLTIRNAAGNSYAYKDDSATLGSAFFGRTDIVGQNPDLILFESSYNRYGAELTERLTNITRWLFDEDLAGARVNEARSIRSLLDSVGLAASSVDFAIYTVNVGEGNFTTGDENDITAGGEYLTWSDSRDQELFWFANNKPNTAFVDSHGAIRQAAEKYYGSYSAGLTASSPGGHTLLADSVHPNDRGIRTFYEAISYLFRF